MGIRFLAKLGQRMGSMFALLLAPAALFAQPAIDVSLNDQGKFVLSADNYSTLGIEFNSPSGSLIPAPIGADGKPDSAPFPLALSNHPHRVTFGTLPPTVTLDGEVTLKAGWNPNGNQDVWYRFGNGDEVAGPFDLAPERYQGTCTDCPPPFYPQMRARLDDQNRLTLNGGGHQLDSLRFDSESGSLRPATDAGPFSSLTQNTANSVQFQADTPVQIDGLLTLPVGWNELKAGRDLTYQYELGGGQTGATGTFEVSQFTYPDIEHWAPIRVDFDTSDKFVLVGRGQPLAQFELSSPSGSLQHLGGAGPFATVTGDAQQLSFAAENTAVVVDGRLTLPVRWPVGEPDARKDLRYRYQVAGDPVFKGPRSVPTRDYPKEPVYPGLYVAVNDDYQVELRGQGQPLHRLSLNSSGGSLIPGSNAAPFQSLGKNNTQRVDYLADSDAVVLDGTVVLDTGWDPDGLRDGAVEYDLAGVSADVRRGFSSYPAEPNYPRVDVRFNSEAHLQLTGRGQPLRSLELNSNSGSLLPGETPGPFASLSSNTSRKVEYLAGDSPVELAGTLVLDTKWDTEGTQDVVGSYDLDRVSDDVRFRVWQYPRDPKQIRLQASVNEDYHVELFGEGQPINTLAIRSPSGSLEPGEGAGPFAELGQNTDTVVEYLGGDSPVVLEGQIVLDTKWKEDGRRDVRVQYEVEGVAGNSNVVVTDYPGELPIEQLIQGVVPQGGGPITLVSSESVGMSGLDITSTSGGLVPIPGGDASPFTFLLSNTQNQITYGNLGSVVTIHGTLRLDVEYYPTAGDNFDLAITWGNGATPVSMFVHELPEPSGQLMAIPAGLVLLALTRKRRR